LSGFHGRALNPAVLPFFILLHTSPFELSPLTILQSTGKSSQSAETYLML
jgi:hypothetical protein